MSRSITVTTTAFRSLDFTRDLFKNPIRRSFLGVARNDCLIELLPWQTGGLHGRSSRINWQPVAAC